MNELVADWLQNLIIVSAVNWLAFVANVESAVLQNRNA
jgi:hypothetical protein